MLMDDPVLGGGMQLMVIHKLAEREHTRLAEYEQELVTLTEVVSANYSARSQVSWWWRQPAVTQLSPRTQHLADAIAESNRVLEGLVNQRQAIESSLVQESGGGGGLLGSAAASDLRNIAQLPASCDGGGGVGGHALSKCVIL